MTYESELLTFMNKKFKDDVYEGYSDATDLELAYETYLQMQKVGQPLLGYAYMHFVSCYKDWHAGNTLRNSPYADEYDRKYWKKDKERMI